MLRNAEPCPLLNVSRMKEYGFMELDIATSEIRSTVKKEEGRSFEYSSALGCPMTDSILALNGIAIAIVGMSISVNGVTVTLNPEPLVIKNSASEKMNMKRKLRI